MKAENFTPAVSGRAEDFAKMIAVNRIELHQYNAIENPGG
jgi:hypothetical protein